MKQKIKIKDLFEYLKISKYGETKCEADIKVPTPSGFQSIKSFYKKKDHRILEIKTETDRCISVSEHHVFSSNGEMVYAKDIEYVDTVDGLEKVVSKRFVKVDDVYDMQIPAPHWYYDNSGYKNHNSHVGKSGLGSSVASNMILAGKNVLIVTLEMSDKEYFKRVDANVLDIDINALKDIDKNVIHDKFSEIKHNIGRSFSKEFPSGSLSALQLEALLHQYRNEKDFIPDIIIVDYLGLMRSDSVSSMNNTNVYFTSVAVELRAIAQKHEIPILSFAQLNRQGIGNTEVDESLMADAKGIMDTCDVLIMLMNNPDMRERGEILLNFKKNRNTGRINEKKLLSVDFNKMRFVDVEDNPDAGTSGDERFQELNNSFEGSPDMSKPTETEALNSINDMFNF